MTQSRKGPNQKTSRGERDSEQSERFIEAARKLGAEKSAEKFDEAFQKIVPAKKKKSGPT